MRIFLRGAAAIGTAVLLVVKVTSAPCDDALKTERLEARLTALKEARSKAAEGYKPLAEVIRSAENGDAIAQAELGKRYAYGLKAEKNREEAYRWYLAAAEQGHAEAQAEVGSTYRQFLPAQEREKLALSWILKAADGCERGAQYTMGNREAYGIGRPIDYAKATAWYRKAALNKHGGAMFELARLYAEGPDTMSNDIEALAWLLVLRSIHDPGGDSVEKEQDLRTRLSAEEIGAASSRSQELLEEIKSHQCPLRLSY